MLQDLANDGMTSAEGPAERYQTEIVDVDVSVVRMIDGDSTKEF